MSDDTPAYGDLYYLSTGRLVWMIKLLLIQCGGKVTIDTTHEVTDAMLHVDLAAEDDPRFWTMTLIRDDTGAGHA